MSQAQPTIEKFTALEKQETALKVLPYRLPRRHLFIIAHRHATKIYADIPEGEIHRYGTRYLLPIIILIGSAIKMKMPLGQYLRAYSAHFTFWPIYIRSFTKNNPTESVSKEA